MGSLIKLRCVEGYDGIYRPAEAPQDHPSAFGRKVEYPLTGRGVDARAEFGVDASIAAGCGGRLPAAPRTPVGRAGFTGALGLDLAGAA